MIKLKSLLSEHINDYSWLAPDGTFYPSHDHVRMAKIILLKMNLSPMERDGIEYAPYELMFKYGFLRVTNISNYITGKHDIYANNRYNTPTNAQARALTNLAIEGGFGKVVFTKVRDDYFTIWDSAHKLE